MPKKKRPLKRRKKIPSRVSRKAKRKKSRSAKLTLKERLARAKKLEALDAGKPTFRVLPRALKVTPENVHAAPSPVITGSVGRWEKGARNLQADVETVQRLLETTAQKLQAPERIRRVLMERLRGSLRSRIPSLRSKLFRSVQIFRLMD